MSEPASSRRVVVTGVGLVSALGNDLESFAQGLYAGQNPVQPLQDLPSSFPVACGAEAASFTGKIDDFGPLPKEKKRAIRKGLKVMCREIQMGVAAAQWALHDAGWGEGGYDPDRSGMVFGSDYILTTPDEFEGAVRACLDDGGRFDYSRWGEHAIPKVAPLWLLKYLPNMPASHIAIYNDLRGPSNSLTVREASSLVALQEATTTILRGHADVMLAGATGTRIHVLRTIHIAMQEEVIRGESPDAFVARPFDARRNGMVLGEAAAVLVLEEAAAAQARGASILAEVAGAGSAAAYTSEGRPDRRKALHQAMRAALRDAGMTPDQIGHYQAQGLSTRAGDAAEASAVRDLFGEAPLPVTSVGGCIGNPGAAVGFLQIVGGIAALREDHVFRLPNFAEPDPECPVRPATGEEASGNAFLCAAASPQAQAGAAILRRYTP
ncbi:MAG TPA: beta-ketoacyl-[acyl-carrier-protein] synthase family protein [Planctomycetaceae bacterium]|nr:beta-ketoacyl-[acyl-carrier-protein] synthase family protein [Planctomycetaceae bacterium]